jgi:hypothetical protein
MKLLLLSLGYRQSTATDNKPKDFGKWSPAAEKRVFPRGKNIEVL